MIELRILLMAFCLTTAAPAEHVRPAAGHAAAAPDTAPVDEGLSEEGMVIWRRHVESFAGVELQKGCEPVKMNPPRGTYRGIVILYHGFTACSQQWVPMARQLVAMGYEVLIPNLPGHGHLARVVNGKRHDDLGDLPGEDDWNRYLGLTQTMDAIAREARGKRMVGGLSVGGVMALESAASGVYDRSLVLTPFLEASTKRGSKELVETLGHLLPHLPLGWGKDCVEGATAKVDPRAGYCDWSPTHINSVRNFGHHVLSRVRDAGIAFPGEIQIVAVTADPAANNRVIAEAFHHLKDKGANVTAGIYPKGVAHAIPSHADSPGVKKFWIDSFEYAARAFFDRGGRFPLVNKTGEVGLPEISLGFDTPQGIVDALPAEKK